MMTSGQDGKSRWICPNDRELTLRAKLETGWCVKTGLNSPSSSNQISELEQQIIMDVLKRSQQIEKMESNRITRLQDRLNNMKRNARGDGSKCCALCNDHFGLFAAQCHICKDCSKSVCSKCGVDTVNPKNEPIWLCKICSETREIWKKSGAWFFQKIPKFNLPTTLTTSPAPSSNDTNDQRKEPLKQLSESNQIQAHEPLSRSRLSSPIMRRKTRSPSPRKYRYALSPEINEYGAALEAGKSMDSEERSSTSNNSNESSSH